MLANSRNTPWRHDSELALVRDWLFPKHASSSSDPYDANPGSQVLDTRQRGIQKVNLWVFKAGRISHAIMATAWLTEAKIFDETQFDRQKHLSRSISGEGVLKSVYAMAFLRFVNGFVDRDVARDVAREMNLRKVEPVNGKGNAKGSARRAMDEENTGIRGSSTGESSMYAYAATIGMPDTFVNLRHRVTHGEMPSLTHLREMNECGLNWLWETWWSGETNIKGTKRQAQREIAWRAELGRKGKQRREKDQQVRQALDGDEGQSTISTTTKFGNPSDVQFLDKAAKRKRNSFDGLKSSEQPGKRWSQGPIPSQR